MKTAVLSDIHANLEALEAVIAECKQYNVDRYVCLGDVVGYNADPGPCLDRIRELTGDVVVQGNHDEQAATDANADGFSKNAKASIEWTRSVLSAEQRRYLDELPLTRRFDDITIVHATLDAPRKWGYVFDRMSAATSFSYQLTPVCFCGHSHVPLAYEKFGSMPGGQYTEIAINAGHKYLINAGSVGQPRDGDWRAGFVIYDEDAQHVNLYRIPYDIEKTQQKIVDAGLPERNASRLKQGR